MLSISSIQNIIEIQQSADKLEAGDNMGNSLIIPKYDISPQEYLEFSKDGLQQSEVKNKLSW